MIIQMHFVEETVKHERVLIIDPQRPFFNSYSRIITLHTMPCTKKEIKKVRQ